MAANLLYLTQTFLNKEIFLFYVVLAFLIILLKKKHHRRPVDNDKLNKFLECINLSVHEFQSYLNLYYVTRW